MSAPANSVFKVGLVQMRSGLSPRPISTPPAASIEQARKAGADYVLTPEMTNIMEIKRERLFAAITEEENDPTLIAMRELARKHEIFLHIGSLAIKASPDKAVNRSFLINRPARSSRATTRSTCSTSISRTARAIANRNNFRPGELAVVADLPWGRLGMTICYDLRFPALYRALAEAGASFLAIPAAFTKPTGEAHWQVLMRARAIENGCFVFAAAQGGMHENGRATFGHSLVVDPWGKVLAEAGDEPGVIVADVDPAAIAAARGRIPSLQHGRRFEVIEPMAEPTHLRAVRAPS